MKTSDLSIKELAAIIAVSTDTIRRIFRKGEIPATRVRTALRFDLRVGRERGREVCVALKERTGLETYLT